MSIKQRPSPPSFFPSTMLCLFFFSLLLLFHPFFSLHAYHAARAVLFFNWELQPSAQQSPLWRWPRQHRHQWQHWQWQQHQAVSSSTTFSLFLSSPSLFFSPSLQIFNPHQTPHPVQRSTPPTPHFCPSLPFC